MSVVDGTTLEMPVFALQIPSVNIRPAMTLPLEPNRRYTVEEYLELEGASPQDKFEYRGGRIVNMRDALPMAGGSDEHCLITANVIRALGNRLEGGPCRVYSNDMRVLIPRRTLFTYPDATVVCGQSQHENHPTAGKTLSNPRLIVEVLSPSTELYDRGDKFALYREISSLAEYVLVSQSHPRIEGYFRREDGGWTFGPYEGLAGAAARLLSLNIELPLKEVYAGIEFPSS
jgi:Uma2 family endonuclease